MFWLPFLLMPALAAEPPALRAGAARIDITPAKDAALPMAGYRARTEGHKGILDHIYTRALVLDNGSSAAAVIAVDVLAFSHTLAARITERVSKASGIPQDHILLAAVHTHAAPTTREQEGNPPALREYQARLEDAIVEAVKKAQAGMKPARLGAGAGKAYININRRAMMADGTWYLGLNPEGPSDKTVAVVKVETAEGKPIALLINYAAHGTAMSQQNYLISGDFPGATSRYVERHFGGDVVALWTSGAAGDQAPLYDRMPVNRYLDAMGRILGEEAIRVANGIRTSANARIAADRRVVTCPGRRLREGVRRQQIKPTDFIDSDPVPINLSLLMAGKIALAGVSGEVLTMIGQRLKRESPFTHTIMLTHTNGSSGYIPDDAAYERISYEIYTSVLKPGCAEDAIIGAFVDMMNRF